MQPLREKLAEQSLKKLFELWVRDKLSRTFLTEKDRNEKSDTLFGSRLWTPECIAEGDINELWHINLSDESKKHRLQKFN